MNLAQHRNVASRWLSAWRSRQAQRQAPRQWARLVQTLPLAGAGPVRLHIGCGDIDAPGFLNIDARPAPHVHIVTNNLFRLEMVPDNAADMVYMCHVLEHVPLDQVVATLKEMHRVLRPDGILRLSVPDLDLMIAVYQATGRRIGAIERALMGGQNHAYNFHYAVFNAERLRDDLLSSGFRETRRWDAQNCAHHDFDDWASLEMVWQDQRFPISLNLEGVK